MSVHEASPLESFHQFVAEQLRSHQRANISPEEALALWRERQDGIEALREGLDDVEAGAKDDGSRIVETPKVCGGDARIRGTRIPVWTLEVARRDGCSDADILTMYADIGKADLIAAWEWVSLHRGQIESAIRENEEE